MKARTRKPTKKKKKDARIWSGELGDVHEWIKEGEGVPARAVIVAVDTVNRVVTIKTKKVKR